MRLAYAVVVVAVIGCKHGKKEPRFEGPMPITFGDCAGPKTTWLSGPRPLPFKREDADAVSPEDTPATAESDVPVEPDVPPEVEQEMPPAQGQGAFASLTGTGDISSGFDDTNIYGGLLGSGWGSGGGAGWGTIGTGRYGTIGRGTGSRYGVGGGRHSHSNGPTVSIGQPNAQGDLDKAIIRRYIKRNISKITYCYEKQLLVNPKLEGTVQTQFFIAQSGSVSSASASGVDANVANCVAAVIKGIEFPKPKGGGGVQVNYPFTFRPADASAATVAAAGSGATAAPPQPDPPPQAAPPPPPPPATPRQLFADASHTSSDTADYAPGAQNPLRDQAAELVECLRKARTPTHYGVFVVELTYDASGKATNADPHGLFDERARTCITKVALKAAHAGTSAERCSVAYGEMPLASLPTLEVSAQTIKLDGQAIAWPPEEMAHQPITKIPALTSAIQNRRKQAVAAGAPVVTQHGPLVVKPTDATPMKDLWPVLVSVLAAGDDLVLAATHDTSWGLLEPITLPVVPVPLATGGRYNHIKAGLRDPEGTTDDERVTLSLLVTKDKIWVGISRVNELQAIARDASADATLHTLLEEHKRSAFFADRNDIEIAGEDDVTYREIVHEIALAKTTGFTAWRLTNPQHLAARPQE